MMFSTSFSKCFIGISILSSLLSPVLSAANTSPNSTSDPRIIYYHGTLTERGKHISLLPLINNSSDIVVSHLILASLQVWPPGNEFEGLNVWTGGWDTPINASNLTEFWSDKAQLQKNGIKVIGSLLGSYPSMQLANESTWEQEYKYLHDGLKTHDFDGIDLDIEDANPQRTPRSITLNNTIRLIDSIRKDFGPDFLITMSPVASCLSSKCSSQGCISGFDYKALEQQRGKDIAFYNAQFYNGFGDANTPQCYEDIVSNGFAPEKVVMGVPSSPSSTECSGWVPWDQLQKTLKALNTKYLAFGGVFGWEYFDSEPGGQTAPWEWSQLMAQWLGVSNATNVKPRKETACKSKNAVKFRA
ncbi:glycoside hydrolase [Rhizodiscina lignyota]|uniref:chitinase n=1 Tax=Rhizodiscina lignyota TaxID=1504668 RepID=A0A9P4M5H7_9PEZI|nr:glycoside hydrolase [Rhizodiscina lignyota]